MTGWSQPLPYDPNRHRTDRFDSGEAPRDGWLRAYAGQGQRRDASRTFVVAVDGDHVIAYYTLVAGEVAYDEAAGDVRRGLSRHFPIPVCVLARIAVDRRHQGAGLGAALLADALARAVRAAEEVSMRAVVVHALHERAAAFYVRFGLEPVADGGLTLMVTVAQLRAAMGPASG